MNEFKPIKVKPVISLKDYDKLNLGLVDCSLGKIDLMSEFMKLEEKLLTDVLRMILKREPVLEDAKRLTKFIYEGREGYELGFDGYKIGTVKRKPHTENFGIEFTPSEEYS